jgi:exodeoxyribonuclease III
LKKLIRFTLNTVRCAKQKQQNLFHLNLRAFSKLKNKMDAPEGLKRKSESLAPTKIAKRVKKGAVILEKEISEEIDVEGTEDEEIPPPKKKVSRKKRTPSASSSVLDLPKDLDDTATKESTSSALTTDLVDPPEVVDAPAKKAPKKRSPPAPPSIHAGPSIFSLGEHLRAPTLKHFIRSIPPKINGCIKIACYNVNGLRSIFDKAEKLDAFRSWINAEGLDMLAIQEHKCQDPKNSAKAADVVEKAEEFFTSLGMSHSIWAYSQEHLGYSGVAVFSKAPFLSTSLGVSDPEGDAEGRTITIETLDYFLVNLYMPNSGVGDLKRLDYRTTQFEPKLRAHLTSLSLKKPVLLCGDLNVAFHDMDVHDPKSNRNKSAGFCDAERDGFASLLSECQLEDIFRERYPSKQQFTYFSTRFDCRTKGKGWRLDYLLATPSLAKKVKSIAVRASFPIGADHLPIIAEIC